MIGSLLFAMRKMDAFSRNQKEIAHILEDISRNSSTFIDSV